MTGHYLPSGDVTPTSWIEMLLASPDEMVAFNALSYKTDQRDGRPTQGSDTKRVDEFEGRSDEELEHFAIYESGPSSYDPPNLEPSQC